MKKHYFITSISALIIGLFLSLLFSLGFFSSWRDGLTDKLFLPGKPNDNIIIVAIDNESLQELGRWPWDREVHAQLINKINEQQPAVIGLDVNFPEISKPGADTELAQAIKRAGNIILPIEAELAITKDNITTTAVLLPITEIREAALDVGLTNTPPDSDGIFRRLPTVVYDKNGKEYFSFSKVIARQFLTKRQFYLSDIPVDAQERMIVNYVGQPGTFSTVPASDIINKKIPEDLFRNKIVLIGATAPDLHDEQIVPTSQGRSMSGVEIHANAVHTILTNNFLSPLSLPVQLAIFIFLAVLVSLLAVREKILSGLIITFIILAIYIITALVMFDRGLILDLFYPILIIAITYLTTIIWRYLSEVKEKRQIKNTFSRYVSPEIIEEILAHPERLKLGGEKKKLTILFSDIRGFTTISEKLSPEKLVQLLNEYLTVMTDIIMESGGVVDKYIGDAIMAFWGAPIKQPQHASRACRVALNMVSALDKKRAGWQKEFAITLRVGIGLNTGDVIIGNMGSDKRFDYTIMGDSVNLASRLEGITKQYGIQIAVSQFTKNKAGHEFVFRYLDKVAVKGKTEGVEIYELVGDETCLANKKTKELISLFEQGVKLYKNREWALALDFFTNLLNKYPDDIPSKLYLERCQEFKNNPPGENWDGIYQLTSK